MSFVFQSLSLYPMTQCQMKLHHSVTSLAQTLDHIEVVCQNPRYKANERLTLDRLLLKLSERKILRYMYMISHLTVLLV